MSVRRTPFGIWSSFTISLRLWCRCYCFPQKTCFVLMQSMHFRLTRRCETNPFCIQCVKVFNCCCQCVKEWLGLERGRGTEGMNNEVYGRKTAATQNAISLITQLNSMTTWLWLQTHFLIEKMLLVLILSQRTINRQSKSITLVAKNNSRKMFSTFFHFPYPSDRHAVFIDFLFSTACATESIQCHKSEWKQTIGR